MTVRVEMRSVPPSGSESVTDSPSMSTTVRLTKIVTPRPSSERAALRDSEAGKPLSTRSSASTRMTRAVRGSMARKSPCSVSRASSPIWPAISTPVGPAPTTTNVISVARASGSLSISAASNARRIGERTSMALSSVLTSAANSRQCSCPK